MGTTSNYSWPYPEATGLVKDGWEDIKDLATAIDTTAASTFAGGLVKISGASFTTASSVSLPNSTFTSTYRNYRILFTGTASATSSDNINLRFRASGTDNSASSYFSWTYNRSNTAANNGYATGTSSTIGYLGNANWHITVDVLQPQATATTMFTSTSHTLANSNNNSLWAQGCFNGTDSFDALTLLPASGTITGQYVVYGYKA